MKVHVSVAFSSQHSQHPRLFLRGSACTPAKVAHYQQKVGMEAIISVGQKLVQDFLSGLRCPLTGGEVGKRAVGRPGSAEKEYGTRWNKSSRKWLYLISTGCEGFPV